jgi:hypothetical protein
MKPTCPKNDCNSTQFEVVKNSLPELSDKLFFVCCSKCGAIISIIDAETKIDVKNILKKLK